jgi:hypothetical protein
MFKSSKEYEAVMYEILIAVRDSDNYRNILESKIGNDNFDDALERCIDLGFIAGLHSRRAASGKLLVDIMGNIRLTYDGLKFIESFKP